MTATSDASTDSAGTFAGGTRGTPADSAAATWVPATEEPSAAHTGTAALLVNDAGHYLLHLRDNIPGICDPGAWSLIGGSREGDESAEETVNREIHEEIGLVVRDLRPFGMILLANAGKAVTGRIQVFLGHWSGDAHALPLTEGVMCHWFTGETAERLRLSSIAATAIRHHRPGS